MPFRSYPRAQWSLAKLLGIVCIALVLVSGFIQVTHTHPVGQVDHDCSLCTTAHQVVQIAVVVVLALSIRPVIHSVPDELVPRSRQRFIFKLASRPPPVVSVIA